MAYVASPVKNEPAAARVPFAINLLRVAIKEQVLAAQFESFPQYVSGKHFESLYCTDLGKVSTKTLISNEIQL